MARAGECRGEQEEHAARRARIDVQESFPAAPPIEWAVGFAIADEPRCKSSAP
jgi:hypothetical protein